MDGGDVGKYFGRSTRHNISHNIQFKCDSANPTIRKLTSVLDDINRSDICCILSKEEERTSKTHC